MPSTCFYLFNHSFFIYAIFLFQFLLIFFLSFPHKLIPIFIPAFYSFHIPSLLVLILCRPILSPRFSFYHPLTDPPRKLSSLPVFPSALDGFRRGSIRVPIQEYGFYEAGMAFLFFIRSSSVVSLPQPFLIRHSLLPSHSSYSIFALHPFSSVAGPAAPIASCHTQLLTFRYGDMAASVELVSVVRDASSEGAHDFVPPRSVAP